MANGTRHTSAGIVFTKFLVSAGAILTVMFALNTLARQTAGMQGTPWESFQEDASTQSAGQAIMRQMGCFACHRIDNFGGEIGPRLNGVKYRKTREQMFRWIKSPMSVKPTTIMPQFDLTDKQILEIISYLETKE